MTTPEPSDYTRGTATIEATPIPLPGGELAPIAQEYREMVPVGREEIGRFAEDVRDLKNPIASAKEWIFLCAGICATGLFALVAAVIDGAGPLVLSLYGAITLGAGFATWFSWWFGGQAKAALLDKRADDCADRIMRLNERAPRPR